MKTIIAIVWMWILQADALAVRQEAKNGHHAKMEHHKASHHLTNIDTETNDFLRIAGDLKNRSAISGDEVQFKCKVEASSKKNIQYTWYKDGNVIFHQKDRRFLIISRPWGSKLRIKPLYTFDSGMYRCEVSNGVSYAYTSAMLSVSFELPPPLKEDEKPKIKLPNGKCEKYRGLICRDYFQSTGNRIFVDAFENQTNMDQQINVALKLLSASYSVSEQCQKFALPAFCSFVFPICSAKLPMQSGVRLCKEDCERLKSDICHREFMESKNNPILKTLLETANCSHLPSKESSSLCIEIGLPNPSPPLPKTEDCYHNKGEHYQGDANMDKSGQVCANWPKHFSEKFPELNGHNFCRNPNKKMPKPWCFVDSDGILAATACSINQCEMPLNKNVYYLAIFGAAGILLLALMVIILRWRLAKRNNNKYFSSVKHPKLFHVSETNLRTLSELGFSSHGKVFNGFIVDDSRFLEKKPFVFKFFDHQHTKVYLEQFRREIEILSQLNHPNITNLKGIGEGAHAKCMIFEYTSQVNLHKYLQLNSSLNWKQHVDVESKNSNFTGVSTDLLIVMASQIASAICYLNSKQFIFHDLSARNIWICKNMNVKLCTLGFVNDAYLDNYYKNDQEKLLPIRWMAPESLLTWRFTDKSTVWSFGVLLWEMFSYGLQPYCGYSNQEVFDMISGRQLLTCPDQCPAKIYSFMQECWAAQPSQRPSFTTIAKRLREFRRYDTIPVIKNITNNHSANKVLQQSIENVSHLVADDHLANHETACLLDPQKSSDYYPK